MITIACATDDKIHFSDNHFGDASFYNIYQVTDKTYRLIKTIENSLKEEDEDQTDHGSSLKAKHMKRELKALGVEALMNLNFGPNIARMKTRFTPVITREKNLARGVLKLVQNYTALDTSRGEEADHKVIKL